ncbi:MAG: peptide chain release factor-like protein [Deltaproteobacteria bacterium]
MAKPSFNIREEDIEVTHVRGSGPGGQNRNKRMSGVRIRHLPTGITITATERRSQEQNRKAALERLECKIKELYRKPKPRVKTVCSGATREKRLTLKRKISQKKDSRRVSRADWES